jgi:hypothetical protein
MKPLITVLTIGVDDLKKSMKFHRNGLGLKTEGIVGKEFEFGAVFLSDLQYGQQLKREAAHVKTNNPVESISLFDFTPPIHVPWSGRKAC